MLCFILLNLFELKFEHIDPAWKVNLRFSKKNVFIRLYRFAPFLGSQCSVSHYCARVLQLNSNVTIVFLFSLSGFIFQ